VGDENGSRWWLRGGGGWPEKCLEGRQRARRQVKGSSRVMECRQAGAKSIDPAMRGRGWRCRGESRLLGMGGKRKRVETKANYTVQAQTKA
jgi:hypothetical protein